MKAKDTFTTFLVLLALLVTFGITAFQYFVIALSTGAIDLAYLIAIWVILVISARLSAVASYVVACLCGIFLTFPMSSFIHFSENGSIKFADSSAIAALIGSRMVLVWMLEYVAVTLIAQFAIRYLWRGMNANSEA